MRKKQIFYQFVYEICADLLLSSLSVGGGGEGAGKEGGQAFEAPWQGYNQTSSSLFAE